MIAKVSSTDAASRQMAVATGAYQREVLFYERLRELTDIRSPQCFHGEVADDLCGFVLLLEDMGPAQTVEQIGGCNPDQADLALAQAAALHGGWRHSMLTEQKWLPVEHVWGALAEALPHVIGPWLERFGAYLQPDHHSRPPARARDMAVNTASALKSPGPLICHCDGPPLR